MQINIIEAREHKIAEVVSAEVVLSTPQDALDLMSEARYSYQASRLILHQENISPEFFDLRTRVAGEILLKFSNYQIRLAIIGDFEKYPSQSLQAFIRESNQGNQVFFVPDLETAIAKLSG